MNIMIFEDDVKFAECLSEKIYIYFHELIKSIHIDMITKDFSFDITTNCDIAFVDINLGEKNGITLAKYIKNLSPQTLIIFVSSKEELVFHALSVSTFQFIRKSKFDEDCMRVFEQLYQYILQQEKKILLEIDGRKTVIHINNIQFILSFGRDLLIKTTDNEYILPSSIKSILNRIEEKSYYDLIQISRNQVINLNYIFSIQSSTIVTIDGKNYTIGRKYKDELVNRYEEYLLR